MKVGIDLLWVRPGICGGTESYIRNLMEGFGTYDTSNEYLLFVARDNRYSFEKYERYPNMCLYECAIDCRVQAKRILWENLYLDRLARKRQVDVMFIPVYSKPLALGSKIPYVCVIHDLQALHYPQYFSWGKRLFFRFMWWAACRTAERVIVISEFGKKDLISRYPFVENRVEVIYNPVASAQESLSEEKQEVSWTEIAHRYGIEKDRFFYCVSSLLPHKNLPTVLKAMALLRKENPEVKLVLSGVGKRDQAFDDMVKDLDLGETVIHTGYISDMERDYLYENCHMFLFPSIFEGFGMPPIEVMQKGKRVVMTRESCLEEVTEGRAVYVEDPFDPEEWVHRIKDAEEMEEATVPFEQYGLERITRQYVRILEMSDNRLKKI